MKSSFFNAGVMVSVLSALSVVNSAAVGPRQVSVRPITRVPRPSARSSVSASSPSSSTASARFSTVNSASAINLSPSTSTTTTTVSTTAPQETPTAGGLVNVQVYTTCLTLTFGVPTQSFTFPPTSEPTDSASPSASRSLSSSVPAGRSSSSARSSSIRRRAASSIEPTPTTLPDDLPTVFTTCLIFLPTPTIGGGSPTQTPDIISNFGDNGGEDSERDEGDGGEGIF
ncbi:hypothetical protein C8J57DRAFT_1533946 [Mycena rebaudengoi]|nr:hypothetical protein C8J57DRAFT_1537625 [Mycena rebaudengoi]KAJ7231142.1 hypothetical protein C8J57DRAFT_1533946 [Mycena rebaudengoi]